MSESTIELDRTLGGVLAQASDNTPQPPQPPAFDRRLNFYLLQLIGVPLLLLVPVLALFGVFGVSFDEANAQGQALELRVTYPSRVRYGLTRELQVAVRNVSEASLSSVTVSFDQAYIERFSGVVFTPSAETVTDEVYRVELSELQPGESRLVNLELRADAYGLHRGEITASPESGESVELTVSTMIYP